MEKVLERPGNSLLKFKQGSTGMIESSRKHCSANSACLIGKKILRLRQLFCFVRFLVPENAGRVCKCCENDIAKI